MLLSILLQLPLQAQQPHVIRQALLLKTVDTPSNTNYIDPIENAIVQGTWTPPSIGDSVHFGNNDTTLWRQIEADSSGWFNDRDLRSGYAYISINSDTAKTVLLEGMGYRLAYVNGLLRTGNIYQYREEWQPWQPTFDFCFLPVRLKAGQNNILVYGARVPRFKVRIHNVSGPAVLNTRDRTLPDLLVGQPYSGWGATVVINTTEHPLTNLALLAQTGTNDATTSALPVIAPFSVRKVPFRINAPAPIASGSVPLKLNLLQQGASGPIQLDEQIPELAIKEPTENHRRTFISEIDGSVQYFGLNPAQAPAEYPNPALVLSVHGAAVEAINQSGSYNGKNWAHIVAPTNRRPYGFNWEDWGRMDALEVLNIATNQLQVDQERIYLTGHSMGGHGTWHIGSLYPDKFAAIAPSAGWISYWSYRPNRQPDAERGNPLEQMLSRATLSSRTTKMVDNYESLGIYIIHGGDDQVVRADESRKMAELLEAFHKDYIYHEEPDQGHWWDLSDEPGADCVDWAPLFDFIARRARPGNDRQRIVKFQTPNPGISSWHHWAGIDAQIELGKMSRIEIRFDPGQQLFTATTDNVARLALDIGHLDQNRSISVNIDYQQIPEIPYPADRKMLWLYRNDGHWAFGDKPAATLKRAARYGVFKDAFRNRVIFVYGTGGSPAENEWAFAKARYDAEHFWYQGNGSIDVIRDIDFDPATAPDRNVIIYGNSKTNSAWKTLLPDSPVNVEPGRLMVGKKEMVGDDLGILFIRPRPGSDVASVGVFSGTGEIGMRSTDRKPAFTPGFAYPDLTIFRAGHRSNLNTTIGAGFFGLDWQLESGEFVWAE